MKSNALCFLGLGQLPRIRKSRTGILRLQLNTSTLLEGCFTMFMGCSQYKVANDPAVQDVLNGVANERLRVARDTTPQLNQSIIFITLLSIL